MANRLPLIAHVVYRFDVGGLENGVVNLVNRLTSFRHVIVAMTEVTDFRRRITRPDVEFVSLNKGPGQGFKLFPRLYRTFRTWRPDIVHTRNMGPLEAVIPAWAAGVPVRIHGEHGWDVTDPDGSNKVYRLERRMLRPLVSHYIALSRDLERYLRDKVGVPAKDLSQIYNGVDSQRFAPSPERDTQVPDWPFQGEGLWVLGTVGRMKEIKDQPNLARAFCQALRREPGLRDRLRLVMVGDGPLREECRAILREADALDLAWLPGERSDIPAIMGRMDCFVLPSRAEGVSNTILEAMACGLPVIATDVGGNGELVRQGMDGLLVPPRDSEALASAVLDYARAPERALAAGQTGRRRIEQEFSLDAMVERYRQVYEKSLAGKGLH